MLCVYAEHGAAGKSQETVEVRKTQYGGRGGRSMVTTPSAQADCTLLVAGGGLGGVAAALKATAMGCDVTLVEPASVLGGAMTSQGVSVLEEHAFIDQFGGTALYYELRRQIKEYYRPHLKLILRLDDRLPNPGSPRRQTPLAFEPKAGVAALERMVEPARRSGRLRVLLGTTLCAAKRDGERVSEVVVETAATGKSTRIRPRYVIDATETGELMPLAGIAYRVGTDCFAETGEPSAPAVPDPRATQSFTYTFAVEFRPGEQHVIPKPELYDELRRTHPFTLGGRTMFAHGRGSRSFLNWRRIIYAGHFASPEFAGDLSLVSSASTDYHDETLIGQPTEGILRHKQRAKQLALSFLYWLQTEAPRDDGKGKGYPELKLRADVMGSPDGLAEEPHIREARRLYGLDTIREQDVAAGYNCGVRARMHPDTVGIGWYPYIDIHRCAHTTSRRGSGQRVLRYQIPLSAMVAADIANFVAGGKTISTTHIANGAYRFQPVEWNIGEAAGALCAMAGKIGCGTVDVALDLGLLRRLQRLLLSSGVPLYWFCDVPIGHPAFFPVQYLAVCGILRACGLDFAPDDPVSPAEAAAWIEAARRQFGLRRSTAGELEARCLTMTRGEVAGALCELVVPR